MCLSECVLVFSMESVGGTDGQGLVVLKLLYFFVHVEFVEVLLGLSFTSTGRLGGRLEYWCILGWNSTLV